MKIVVIGAATSSTSPPAIMFHIGVQRWQEQMAHLFETQMARLFDPYRPERHYMRGPGPKCREKLGLAERAL